MEYFVPTIPKNVRYEIDPLVEVSTFLRNMLHLSSDRRLSTFHIENHTPYAKKWKNMLAYVNHFRGILLRPNICPRHVKSEDRSAVFYADNLIMFC
jgi:hypothetical protein